MAKARLIESSNF